MEFANSYTSLTLNRRFFPSLTLVFTSHAYLAKALYGKDDWGQGRQKQGQTPIIAMKHSGFHRPYTQIQALIARME